MNFSPTNRRPAAALACVLAPVLALHAQQKKAPSDTRILVNVQEAFRNDPVFASVNIIASVNKGVVRLNGTVRSEAEKELASEDIAGIDGVKTVLNNLNVFDSRLRPALAPAPAPAAVQGPSGPKTITLPSGTTLSVRLIGEIDTKTAQAGDTFHGTTASAVSSNAYTLIPSGTEVTGRIAEAKAAGHFSGSAELALELVSARLRTPNGAQDVSVVTQQWSSKAAGRGVNTAEKTGGGAGVGAIIGALAGGSRGAGIGAASGGALGAGTNAITRGKEIDLKPEQLLQFRTTAPVDVTIMLQNGRQVLPGPATITPALEQRPSSSGSSGF